MKYRKLGKSGITVSEIGFGAWTIGMDWWNKKIDDDEAIAMLKKAYDKGINGATISIMLNRWGIMSCRKGTILNSYNMRYNRA